MQNENINNVFCQKPKITTLYNSQIGAVVFLTTLSFKLSSLPAIVSEYLSSSTLWFYIALSVIDILEFALVYLFFKDGSDEPLSDKIPYKIGIVILFLFLGLKCVGYFAFAVLFFTVELYVGISPVIVVSILFVPMLYLGFKGGRTIARTAEILAPIILAIIVLNLIFLDCNIDFNRNLPILSMPLKNVAVHSLKYGLWLGNFFPLFFVKVQNKKNPYVSTSVAVTHIITIVAVMVGVAMYGNAMKLLGNLLVEISGFNQLSTEIGRMEWTALFAVIVMGVIEISFLFFGISECSLRLTRSKLPALIIVVGTVLLLSFILPSPQVIADLAHTSTVGVIMLTTSLLLPIYFLILKAIYKKNNEKHRSTKESL